VNIPQFDYGDNGDNGAPMHFLHANGYPPDCYQPLLTLLKAHHHLFGMTLRPLWPDADMQEIKSWVPFTDDLLKYLTQKGTGPVIGVGHSIGATVTLRAAIREPDKFRALILFDPVLFVPAVITLWMILHACGLGERVHPRVAGALKRRKTFDNLEMVFRSYRTREVFKYMNDESLLKYIEGITRPKADGGYELVFSPEWESHIYMAGMKDLDLWRALPNLKVPVLIIRGSESDTFLSKAADLIKRKTPNIQIKVLEKATHILPLEHPQKVSDLMEKFLKEVL
jgi:pimeloyl-ACP methyl ester carboxylesterase